MTHRLDVAQGRGTGDRNAIGPADPDSRLDLFLANSLTSLGASHYRLTNFGGRVDQLAGSTKWSNCGWLKVSRLTSAGADPARDALALLA